VPWRGVLNIPRVSPNSLALQSAANRHILDMTVNLLSAKEDDIAGAFELGPDTIEELASASELQGKFP